MTNSHKHWTVVFLLICAASVGRTEAGQVTKAIYKSAEKEFSALTAPKSKEVVFAAEAKYRLCFVPDGASCERLVVDAIEKTKSELLVQAYYFTNKAIAKAVVKAFERGVDVKVILDKSQKKQSYSSATYLANANIPVRIDSKVAIAHNKVMVFDGSDVFTGSFNFTEAAQDKNSENGMLIIGDAAIAKAFRGNWVKRYEQSERY